MERQYWAHFKSGRQRRQIGPFATREEAVAAALLEKPKHKTLQTGYGTFGGYSDMRWHEDATRNL
jgi:hypothetical protein